MPAIDTPTSYKACTLSDTADQPYHEFLYVTVAGNITVRGKNDTADVVLAVAQYAFIPGYFRLIKTASTATVVLVV